VDAPWLVRQILAAREQRLARSSEAEPPAEFWTAPPVGDRVEASPPVQRAFGRRSSCARPARTHIEIQCGQQSGVNMRHNFGLDSDNRSLDRYLLGVGAFLTGFANAKDLIVYLKICDVIGDGADGAGKIST
jgi:hypothetical protein